MTTTGRNITQGMTPAEAASLLAKLEEGQRAAWLSTRQVSWRSAEYQSRFRTAAEIDGLFSDLMRETAGNGMRHPGEPAEEFAERAGSEAWLADARTADPEPPADATGQHTGAGTLPVQAGDGRIEEITHLLNDARTAEGQAYARAFSGTAVTRVRKLRQRYRLPEPDRTPGAPHPDPFLASRGWHVGEHGIYTRRAQPQPQPPPERDLEAGR